jgi:NAD kinase
MKPKKILVVRKMSALEYYYNGKHKSEIINECDRNHTQSVQEIERILKKENIKFNVVTRRELSEKLIKSYDAVISAGGDGTVIAVAAYNIDTPQLNLRTDSRSTGAICQKDIPKALNSFLNGQYKIEEWQRQDVYLDGKFIGRASNETCIGEVLRFDRLARYELLFVDAESGLPKEETQSGSGLIIVTGTGSGAWPAAFKLYPKDSLFFEFKTLLQHSGVIEKGRAKYVRLTYKGHEGKFAIDTQDYVLPRDSQLEIKLSKNPLRIVIPD